MNYYKRRVRYIVVQNLKNVLLELMLLFFQKIQSQHNADASRVVISNDNSVMY